MRRRFVFCSLIGLLLLLIWAARRYGEDGRASVARSAESAKISPVGISPIEPSMPAPGNPPAAASERTAFRFRLDDGRVSLERVDRLTGNFHAPRGELDWNAGMFYYRLLDRQSRVLAEDTQPAPDAQCFVVDPKSANRATRMTVNAPVIFQVRLPSFENATRLKIYRLGSSRRVPATEEPDGELLASIEVPK